MDLLSAQIAMFLFLFFLLCAFIFVSICFVFSLFCFFLTAVLPVVSVVVLSIRYLDELRSAQCLRDIGGWHHHNFFYS